MRALYTHRGDGLGTRLMNLGWSWRFARKVDALTVVVWGPSPPTLVEQSWDDARIATIFDLRGNALDRESSLRFIDGRFDPDPSWTRINAISGWKHLASAIDPDAIFADSEVISYDHYMALLLAGENKAEATAEFSALMMSLPLERTVQAAVDSALTAASGRGFSALHYRRGDIIQGLTNAAKLLEAGASSVDFLDRYLSYYAWKCAPASTLIRYLDREVAEGKKIFLCTDDSGMRDQVYGNFANASVAITRPPKMSELQFAMADIMVQAKADSIIGANSGFSKAAALIGGVPISSYKVEGPNEFEADLVLLLGEDRFSTNTIRKMVDQLYGNVLFKRRFRL